MKNFSRYHFQGQKPGEMILLVLHRHWFDILSQMLIILAMIILLGLSSYFLPILFPNLELEAGNNIFFFFELSFTMFIWIVMFLIWIDYYFDVWIVTNKRIVNIEQRGLFIRDVSELELENIQDITTEVKGIIPTLLNYGDVFVQTAAERERFLFHNVPDPYHVKDIVMNLQEEVEKKEAQDFGKMLRKNIPR